MKQFHMKEALLEKNNTKYVYLSYNINILDSGASKVFR